jgi:nicotinic acid mononucleotide adenylyltransferase
MMFVMMLASDAKNLVDQIHASGRHFVLALTGGGSGAISALLQAPGASASVLEVAVPYSSEALDRWIGGVVDQYCSEATARAIAMRAFERARDLSTVDRYSLCGVGATASLATNRPKRGAHRLHVAWQSATTTAVTTCMFTSGGGTRQEEEDISTQVILQAVAEACRVRWPHAAETPKGIDLTQRAQQAPGEWTELLLGERSWVLLATGTVAETPKVLFPGAFNPLHWGHERMAEIASKQFGSPVTFELSITNVDKRPLDFIEIADRLARLSGHPVLLTRAATFVEKAQLAPGCVFVVGADTIKRIADPVYYDGDTTRRDAAIAAIAERGCRFLVFGRTMDGAFTSVSNANVPAPLRAICEEVPDSEFKVDISSTELRSERTQ